MTKNDLVVLFERMKEVSGRDLSGVTSDELANAGFSEDEIKNVTSVLLTPSKRALADMNKHGLQCAGLGTT